MQLSECRVLLTGASGGIGQHIARRLSAGGAKLLLVGRQGERMQALASECGDGSQSVCADISSSEGREQILLAARQFGGINLVINAAGLNQFGLLEQQNEQAIAALIQLNVTATILLTQRLLPILGKQPQAMLVNIGSTFGSIGYPGYSSYCASKFAIRGFTEALRRELADTRVRVLYVAPRATRTRMNEPAVVAMNQELKVAMDDPQLVANALASAIERDSEELYIGWPEKLFVRINGLLPKLVDAALRKQLPVIQRFARDKS